MGDLEGLADVDVIGVRQNMPVGVKDFREPARVAKFGLGDSAQGVAGFHLVKTRGGSVDVVTAARGSYFDGVLNGAYSGGIADQ